MTCSNYLSPGCLSCTAQACRLQGLGLLGPWVLPGEPYLMVGVVLGVGGPLSRLRWLWTGLCAGGTSGLRAGSLRENSETALCTGGQRGDGQQGARSPRDALLHAPPARTSTKPPSHGHCGGILAIQPNEMTSRQSAIAILSEPLDTMTRFNKIQGRNKLNDSVGK